MPGYQESGYFYNAIKRELSMVRGDTLSFAFQLKGLQGQQPEKVVFTCKESLEDTTPRFIVSLDDTIDFRSYDATDDILTYAVRIPPYKTSSLPIGRYFYDLETEVNGDIITLMIGRLNIEYEVHDDGAPLPPAEGDDIVYPREGIAPSSKMIYTEQNISNIATWILEINGAEIEGYTVAEMSEALEDIKDDVDDISTAINTILGTSEPINLSDMASTITNNLGIQYESGEEVYY